MAHKTIPQAQAQPLRALPRGFDSRDDNYRITIPAKLALEAFCLAGMVVLILFTCFVVGW